MALASEVAGAFLAARRAEGCVMWLSPKALVPLLGFLRRLGVAPPPAPAPVTPPGRSWSGTSGIW
jgi:integrase/recombinase XerD